MYEIKPKELYHLIFFLFNTKIELKRRITVNYVFLKRRYFRNKSYFEFNLLQTISKLYY